MNRVGSSNSQLPGSGGSNAGNRFVGSGCLAFSQTEIGQLKVLEIAETSLFKSEFCAIEWAAVNGEDFGCRSRRFHNPADALPNSSQAVHLPDTLFGQLRAARSAMWPTSAAPEQAKMSLGATPHAQLGFRASFVIAKTPRTQAGTVFLRRLAGKSNFGCVPAEVLRGRHSKFILTDVVAAVVPQTGSEMARRSPVADDKHFMAEE